MTSDDDEQDNPTLTIVNPVQYTSHILQRRRPPIQLCQQLQTNLDTPKTPREDQGQKENFRPYDLPNSSTTKSRNSFSNVSSVVDG